MAMLVLRAFLAVALVTAVIAVPVEHVQQRAGEEQQEGQELDEVRAVLGQQEIRRDREKTDQNPPRGKTLPAPAARVLMLVTVHVELR
jgi:hypothetical protein